MRQEGLRANAGYKRPRYKAGRTAALAVVNRLKQDFDVHTANYAWVTLHHIYPHMGRMAVSGSCDRFVFTDGGGMVYEGDSIQRDCDRCAFDGSMEAEAERQ